MLGKEYCSMTIKFKELKQYIARTIPVSICFRDGHYDNYTLISDIPEGRYDDLYVYGIGTIDVELPLDVYKRPSDVLHEKVSLKEGFYLGCALEIVLQEMPRDIQRQDKHKLHFFDLKSYLQSGMNFSVVMQEDWSEEYYAWKEDIPEQYNDLYVYGIGIMAVSKKDIPKEFQSVDYERIKGSRMATQMVIVLSKKPRTDVE